MSIEREKQRGKAYRERRMERGEMQPERRGMRADASALHSAA